jgi:hypothetical protein
LIAGTGHSGILAFMLASGISLDKAKDIFLEIGEDVFESNSFSSKVTHVSNLKNAGWYSVPHFEKDLKDYFCGDKTLGDCEKFETKCFATSSRTTSIGSFSSYLFRSYDSPYVVNPPKSYKGTYKKSQKDIPLIQVLRATSGLNLFHFDW